MCRRLRGLTFVGGPVRAGFGVRICGWPSGTRTAAPATGAATFVHVVECVLVDVCKTPSIEASLLRRSEPIARGRELARARAPTARDVSGLLWWNGKDRACSHDVSGVAAWRGVHTRYRRRSSQSSDGQACHADPVGVPLTRASRGPHNQPGRRPLYEYRTEPAFAQASLPGRVAHGVAMPEVPCVTNGFAITVRDMPGPAAPSPAPAPSGSDLKAELARLTAEYSATANIAALHARLAAIIATATPDALIAAAEPLRDEPEIIAPIYEAIVAAQPDNARALVILANAYWLQGRGPQVVGELATKAIAADPANRGAWHLWALSESDPRARVRRWQQVSERFPGDILALAAVADNAASVAGAEQDYAMLDVAIDTYELLLERTTDAAQREAVSTALAALRGWRF